MYIPRRRKMADEISKETIDKVYEAIEVAKKTGKIKKGTNEVTKAIERGEAKLVAYAKDVNPPEVTMHIPLLCEEKGISCVEVPSKEELGVAAGIGVPKVSVAVTEEGEAAKLVKEVNKPKSLIFKSIACQEYLELYNKKHYPGLGTVKKISMQHHLELIADFLKSES